MPPYDCRRRTVGLVAALVLLALCAGVAGAASNGRGGALDPTFGGDGTVVTSFGEADSGSDVLVQPDGKLVVAGGAESRVGESLQTGFAVARYLPDGTLDPTFGSGGRVVLSKGGGAMAVLRQPDGRLVTAGWTFGEGFDFALARFHPDGSLDASFGGGFLRTDLGGSEGASALLLQPDGRILAAGLTGPRGIPGPQDVALARFDADGTLDPTFGGDGRVVADLGGSEVVTGAALQRDGRIVLAGSTDSPGAGRIAVARFNADGTLDESFDGDGLASPDVPEVVNETAAGVVAQPDGKLVVAISGDGDLTAARLLPDGRLDRGFGAGGLARIRAAGGEYATALALQPNGKVVLAGHLFSPSPPGGDFAAGRLLPDGRADRNFGVAALAVADFGANDYPFALALQADGRIVVVGTKMASRFEADVAVARFAAGTCSVPRLAGVALALARARLAAANCRLGRVTRAFSRRFGAGRVAVQRPAAGRELADWAPVRVVVSRGRRR